MFECFLVLLIHVGLPLWVGLPGVNEVCLIALIMCYLSWVWTGPLCALCSALLALYFLWMGQPCVPPHFASSTPFPGGQSHVYTQKHPTVFIHFLFLLQCLFFFGLSSNSLILSLMLVSLLISPLKALLSPLYFSFVALFLFYIFLVCAEIPHPFMHVDYLFNY